MAKFYRSKFTWRDAFHNFSKLCAPNYHRQRAIRLLIVGCGDVGLRILNMRQHLASGAYLRIYAGTLDPHTFPKSKVLAQANATPLGINLDDRSRIQRLAGIATHVIYLVPPPREITPDTLSSNSNADMRIFNFLITLLKRNLPKALVYVSTTGVYGDAQGQWVSETRGNRHANNPRSLKRKDAEQRVRLIGHKGIKCCILRSPGIYANDRKNGTPKQRLLNKIPVLDALEDVYTNHIHADDLARACYLALWRAKPQRTYNINDDSCLKMGDYFDWAADMYGLQRPARISFQQAQQTLPPQSLGFMSESRRLRNHRMKHELGLSLRYPTVKEGLQN